MTISVNKVLNFDQLPVEAASRILYEEIIAACEAKGIKLSFMEIIPQEKV